MGFWERYKKDENNDKSSLYLKLKEILKNSTDEDLTKIACISGLLARVIYVDMEVSNSEIETMKKVLKEWTDLRDEEIETIANISIQNIIELSGIENHMYTHPLIDLLSKSERLKILEALFVVAASDGNADNYESEEIKTIAGGLGLDSRYFVTAKMKVKDKLGALK